MKNIIKYILLAVFAFVQVQAFAFNNSSDLWKKEIKSLKYNLTEFLFFNKSHKQNMFASHFAISSEIKMNNVWGGSTSCFTGNSNDIEVRFILTNITNSPITISHAQATGSNFLLLRLVEDSNVSLTGFEYGIWDSNKYYGATVTINAGQSLTILGSVSVTNYLTALEVVSSVKFELGSYSRTTGASNNKLATLDADIFGSTKITRIPDSPGDKTEDFNINEVKTVASAFGIPNTSEYRFYKNNVLISGSDVLDVSTPGINSSTYKYSKVNGNCESAKSSLTLEVGPYPGSIAAPANSVLVNNKYQVCYNGTIVLSQSQAAQSYRARALKYTWEFSYDGINWNVYGDTQATEGETVSIGNTSLTINDLKRDILVRRKVHEMITTAQVNWYSYSNIISINVINPVLLYNGKAVNDSPKGSNGIAKVVGSTIEFPVFTVRNGNGNIDPSAKIIIYNELGFEVARNFSETVTGNGTLSIANRTFPTKGFYKYKIVIQEASGLLCSYTEYFNVTIYEPSDCDKYTKKIFATINKPFLIDGLDGVTRADLAVDKDLSTKSTITAAITALGLGPRQKVLFDTADFPGVSGAPIKAGTTVKIKLGQEYSGLNLAGGISLYPLASDGGRIGAHIDAVEGALLDLLVGDNIFEYSYVAPVDLYGIEVYVGGLLGVAVNASLYGVYIEREENIIPNSTNHCFGGEEIKGAALPLSSTIYNNVDTGDPITFPANGIIRLNNTVSDVCWGVQDVGLGVATALASVVYPYLAVDDSYETYTIFNKTVAALNRQFLDVKFNQLGRQGDQIQILLSNSGIDILSLNLLADFKAQRYLGDTPVGDEISLNDTSLVKLSLLWMDGRRRAAIIVPSDVPFDRVRLTYLSIVQVSLGDYTYVHDVSLLPQMYFEGMGDLTNTPTICAAEPLYIEKMEACTNYDISISYKNSQNQFIDISDSSLQLLSGIETINGRDYYRYEFSKLFSEFSDLHFKVQSFRKGCVFGDAQYFSINLQNCSDALVNPVIRTTTKN